MRRQNKPVCLFIYVPKALIKGEMKAITSSS